MWGGGESGAVEPGFENGCVRAAERALPGTPGHPESGEGEGEAARGGLRSRPRALGGGRSSRELQAAATGLRGGRASQTTQVPARWSPSERAPRTRRCPAPSPPGSGGVRRGPPGARGGGTLAPLGTRGFHAMPALSCPLLLNGGLLPCTPLREAGTPTLCRDEDRRGSQGPSPPLQRKRRGGADGEAGPAKSPCPRGAWEERERECLSAFAPQNLGTAAAMAPREAEGVGGSPAAARAPSPVPPRGSSLGPLGPAIRRPPCCPRSPTLGGALGGEARSCRPARSGQMTEPRPPASRAGPAAPGCQHLRLRLLVCCCC